MHTASALTATPLHGSPLRGLSGHFASLVVLLSLATPLRGLSAHFASLVGFRTHSLPRFAVCRGTSLRSWFQKKCGRLPHSLATPLRGLSGHFASLVVSKKVPATYGDFDFFFKKNPTFENLKLDFFPIQYFFRKCAK